MTITIDSVIHSNDLSQILHVLHGLVFFASDVKPIPPNFQAVSTFFDVNVFRKVVSGVIGICWENSPLSSNLLFLFKIFGLTLFELQIRQCFASFYRPLNSPRLFKFQDYLSFRFFRSFLFFRPLGYFWIFGYCRLFGYYPSFLFSFLPIFLEMQKLLFHKPHLLTVLCQYYGLRVQQTLYRGNSWGRGFDEIDKFLFHVISNELFCYDML